jgi:phenylpyruvate tautomerase
MPYLKLQTNVPVPSERRPDLLARASRRVAEALGKPESYVMVALQPDTDMLFAGSDAPLAYLELKSIGLPQARTRELSATLTEWVGSELGVDPSRVYIEFADAERPMWGWKGGTF